MYLIIGGCGRLGSNLGRLFSEEGHEVVIIDTNEEALDALDHNFGGTKVLGNFSNKSILEGAGADKADAVIAVTDDDNTNAVGCQIAKAAFGVEKTVARINDPTHEKSFKKLNIDSIIAPFNAVTKIFKNAVLDIGYVTKDILGGDDVELIEIRVEKDKGKIEDLDFPEGIMLAAISKEEETSLPQDDMEIKKGDRVYFLVETEEFRKNRNWLEQWF